MTEEKQPFHIDKSISVGHILTTITIVVAMIWWASGVETKLAVHESEIAQQKIATQRLEQDQSKVRDEINQKLDKLNDKLDRLMEGRAGGR